MSTQLVELWFDRSVVETFRHCAAGVTTFGSTETLRTLMCSIPAASASTFERSSAIYRSPALNALTQFFEVRLAA